MAAAPAATAPAPQQGAATAAGRNQLPMVPFAQASLPAREQPLNFVVTPGAAPITIGPADLTPNGFLRHVDVHVSTVTAGTNGEEDATGLPGFPWILFQTLQFIDTGGQRMDDLSGLGLYYDNYSDGYVERTDPASAWDFSANPLSPDFRLRIGREIFQDGKGALPNLSGSQKYRVRFVIDAAVNIWDVQPDAYPVLEIDVIDHLWLLPAAVDGGGRPQQRRPPLLGLAQYRTSYYPQVSISSAKVNEQIKANGNLLKYILLWGTDSEGNPTDDIFPDPFTLRVDNSYPWSDVPLSEVIAEYYNALPGVPASRPTGLVLLPFNLGLWRSVGSKGVSSWLPTSTATWIQLIGTQPTPTAGFLTWLVCEISTAEIDPAERSSMNNMTGTWQPAIPADVQGGV